MTIPNILRLKRSILVILLITGAYSLAHSQSCPQMPILKEMVNYHHVRPKLMADEMSAALYKDLFEALDPHGIYFVQSDMDKFKSFELELDNAISTGNCAFIDSIQVVYKKRLEEVDTLIGSIMANTLD